MKYQSPNYYGFDHEKVGAKFKGDLTYIGDLLLTGERHPCAVYRAASPNRELGHKEFMLLQVSYDPLTGHRGGIVRGMEWEELEKHSIHQGVFCKVCEKVLVSIAHHGMASCGCPNRAFVDGGNSYMRFGAHDMTQLLRVEVNMLEGTVVEAVTRPISKLSRPVKRAKPKSRRAVTRKTKNRGRRTNSTQKSKRAQRPSGTKPSAKRPSRQK